MERLKVGNKVCRLVNGKQPEFFVEVTKLLPKSRFVGTGYQFDGGRVSEAFPSCVWLEEGWEPWVEPSIPFEYSKPKKAKNELIEALEKIERNIDDQDY